LGGGAIRPFRIGASLAAAGALAGLAAVALQKTIELCTRALQSGGAGFRVPEVAAYGGHPAALADLSSLRRAWLLPLLLAAGMGLAAFISRLADHAVAGTDGVIAALNARRADRLTLRGGLVKLAATAATLGAGGSGGTEGPVAQIATSLDADLTRRLGYSREDPTTRMLITAGLAGGIGALFRTPCGGTLLGVQILRGSFDLELLLPCAVASVVAYAVFGAILGFGPMLGHAALGPFLRAQDLIPLILLGGLCALLARLYCFALGYLGRELAPLRSSPLWYLPTAVAAGMLLGVAGMLVPEILGTGYGSVQDELSSAVLASAPLWLLLVVPVAKLAATAFTLGAGGVGGVFGPAMVIGGSAGALGWRITAQAGAHPGPAALYVATGVAACLGPATRAATATTAIAVRLVGAWIPPLNLVLAVLLARRLFGRAGLFPSQLDAGAAPAPPSSPTAGTGASRSSTRSRRRHPTRDGEQDPGSAREAVGKG
jgi:CIC family chloride channel protein